MNNGVPAFREALIARKQGEVSQATAWTPFDEVKPEFYADSKLLIDAVYGRLQSFTDSHPPYGLIEPVPPASLPTRWLRLESNMAQTVATAFRDTAPSQSSCPYNEVLHDKLGRWPLKSQHEKRTGLDNLREASAVGGVLAPALIVNIIRRIPAMARMHQANGSWHSLAYNSRLTLLAEPLKHPQQWAKAFMYCLAEGNELAINRQTFMDDAFIARHIRLQRSPSSRVEQLAWAVDTATLPLRSNVWVVDRVHGSENRPTEAGAQYLAGQLLGDIAVNEPRIGCPGARVAYQLWNTAADVAYSEDWWE